MSYIKNGWHIDRNADGSVTICVHVRDATGHVVGNHDLTLSASEWASVVALVSATGKSAKPLLEAIHNGTVQGNQAGTGTAQRARVPNDQSRKASDKARATARGKGKSGEAPTPDNGTDTAEGASAESGALIDGDETAAV